MWNGHHIVALVVAAGRGTRAGEGMPKQYRPLGGVPVLRRTVLAFLRHAAVDAVRVVIHADDRALYETAVGDLPLAPPVIGGASRCESVANGLAASPEAVGGLILIHDAARPFVSSSVIDRCLQALTADAEVAGVVPALAVADSVRRGGAWLGEDVDRAGLLRIQTPQCFRHDALAKAFAQFASVDAHHDFTDDASVALAAGYRVMTVAGDEMNFKLTDAADFDRAEAMLAERLVSRTGLGFDVHAFAEGEALWLAGVQIPHARGLRGHSDADVALHALTDALLGAIGEGDIGSHFPPSDPEWRGAASSLFVEHARSLVEARGGRIDHVDLSIICEQPKIGPHRDAMRQSVAALLRLPLSRVSIKATTTEQLGFTGRGEGIAAQAVATVRIPEEQ
ncbi:bifunctional 2-C-methyl-D-erythritol 4-phosphate cytidylyltransferase/2-C-methyl-D-erythritol 2,4-cyclodiphosphate synthase [Allosphingosinicella humi]